METAAWLQFVGGVSIAGVTGLLAWLASKTNAGATRARSLEQSQGEFIDRISKQWESAMARLAECEKRHDDCERRNDRIERVARLHGWRLDDFPEQPVKPAN